MITGIASRLLWPWPCCQRPRTVYLAADHSAGGWRGSRMGTVTGDTGLFKEWLALECGRQALCKKEWAEGWVRRETAG